MQAVIKIGGSLAKGKSLPRLCAALGEMAPAHHILLVPGGGTFADAVRECAGRLPLSGHAAHWMAVAAMDQYGLLLADLIPDSRAVYTLDEAEQTASKGFAPVLLPLALMRERDPLPHSWDVTSDSIAAWVAQQVKASVLALVKDVDGLFNADPAENPMAELLPLVAVDDLNDCRGVDKYLPTLLGRMDQETWVLSGLQPERLARLLQSGGTRGTRIVKG